MFLSPSFTPGNNIGADYAFLRLQTRISSESLVFRVGTAPHLGDTLLFAGDGLPGSMQEGSLPNTGNVMGFYASFDVTQPVTWNAVYDSGDFTGQHNSGVASGGDSGGSVKWLNTTTGQWESVGTLVGGNLNATFFYPYYNADPYFVQTLNDSVQPISAPEPSAVSLGLVGIVYLAEIGRAHV